MPASKAKEAKLETNENSLDVSVTQTALEDIDACQTDIDTLNEKASEEILSVEQKYNKLRRPHYSKRNEMIQKIPNFWWTAFTNHPQISAILTNEEVDCIQSLTNVDVEEFEDIKSGYKVTFTFKQNPYFTNEKLVKEFHLASSGEPQSKSTEIQWKEGKDLTKGSASETNGRKRKIEPALSFFTWFTNNTDPNADEIAEVIKDDMWPNPLQYYLASEGGASSDHGESDEEDEDDEEDDEQDGSAVVIGDESEEDQEVYVDEKDDDDDPEGEEEDEEEDGE
ncbi:protein SET [Biomphalaria glabrata]|uniref:Protein SET n=1 Tax=Biomphalaria glabrata TaxID=6526 RepID=A0A2C9JZT2_BIOGL|nr:protein SET [Biomphalaria glabrata]KAI8728704.1 protein SET-like [Biomphalaria glabrata]